MAGHGDKVFESASLEHNRSSQQHVVLNDDPALEVSHEHFHAHLHHDELAERGRDDDIAYSNGTTFEKSNILDQGVMDHNLHRRKHPQGQVSKNGKGTIGITDEERGSIGPEGMSREAEEDPQDHQWSHFYARYRIFFHLFIFLLFTGWWIASLVLHRNDKNWIIPFLLWGAITLRLLFFHVPITIVTRPMHWVWNNTGVRVNTLIPEKMRIPAGALLVIAVIIIGAFASEESQDNTRANRAVSLFGLVVFIAVLYATSRNRKLINWVIERFDLVRILNTNCSSSIRLLSAFSCSSLLHYSCCVQEQDSEFAPAF